MSYFKLGRTKNQFLATTNSPKKKLKKQDTTLTSIPHVTFIVSSHNFTVNVPHGSITSRGVSKLTGFPSSAIISTTVPD